MLASALVRPALVLPSAVCSARRWLDPEPTMVVECASCRPFCWLLVNPSSVEGGDGQGDGEAEGRTRGILDAAASGEQTQNFSTCIPDVQQNAWVHAGDSGERVLGAGITHT